MTNGSRQLSPGLPSTLAAIILGTLSISTAAPNPAAAAETNNSSSCVTGLYQAIRGQLGSLNPATGYFDPIGADEATSNALGYRTADGFIYGFVGQDLVKIDPATGAVETLGNPGVAKKPYTGDFGDDGYLYASNGAKRWWKVDVDAMTAEEVPELGQSAAIADVANINGRLYGLDPRGNLYVFDTNTLTWANLGMATGVSTESQSYFGAMWATAGGNLYAGRNNGELYQITGYTTGAPVATSLGASSEASANDGASCSLAPAPDGIPDVDGPAPEEPPATAQARAAAASYQAEVESGQRVVDPESAPLVGSGGGEEEAPSPSPPPAPVGENYEVSDANLGTGASCPATTDADRLPRDTVTPAAIQAETVLYNSGFAAASEANSFLPLAGSWAVEAGEYRQYNSCGPDYTTILQASPLANYRISTTFRGIDGVNQGGIVVGQSSEQTRSGSWLIDLTDNGATLRWGTFDNAGYHRYEGSVPVTAANGTVSLAVTVADGTISITYNGEEITTFPGTATGYVGLSTTSSSVGFATVELVALPEGTAAPETTSTTGS